MPRRRAIRPTPLLNAPGGVEVSRLNAGDEVEVFDAPNLVPARVGGKIGFLDAAHLGPPEVQSVAAQPARVADDVELFTGAASFVGDPVQAHRSFHTGLARLDQIAIECGVQIFVTHSFRRRDLPVAGAIVTPARRSNHLVGHAIDMNLRVRGEHLNSARLQRSAHGTLPREAQLFFQKIRDDGVLRWGGDFVKEDPVHIDDDLARRNPEEWQRIFASLTAGA